MIIQPGQYTGVRDSRSWGRSGVYIQHRTHPPIFHPSHAHTSLEQNELPQEVPDAEASQDQSSTAL